MSYAVIEFQGKQYWATPEAKIVVPGELGRSGKDIVVDSVLLDPSAKDPIGTPTTGTKVTLQVVEHRKSKKIRVSTYKAKSRYRKVKGHRQIETVLKVTSLKGKASPKKSTPKKAPVKTKATSSSK